MDFKLELVILPVSDVDRAKEFYTRFGFNADHDHTVSESIRFVQLTPPGSPTSIAIGKGLTDAPPGSFSGLQLVVKDIDAARSLLIERDIEVSEISRGPGGAFLTFADPDGNRWTIQDTSG
jgi:catechol 2,3-dioxygenase-like lactoylglutathione lyase family enzyme